VLVVLLVVAACAGRTSTVTTGRPVRGGSATMALRPGAQPSYIFPFMAVEHLSVANVSNLQYLLYRPLYWFGDGDRAVVNDRLSLADPPTFADGNRTVTVKLRPYRWSDGTPVTADNVVFWMNMMKADKATWAAYVPGGLPDDVDSITVDAPDQLTFHLNKTYSATWFQYNELSQITPMPHAWDRTADGPKDCEHRVADCDAVYQYLAGQAKLLNQYATNPLWQVVDGPWRLKTFNADGHLSFVPNPSYAGPDKPHLDEFAEAPFATDAAEYNVLRSGDGSLQVGYLPQANAPAIPPGQRTGHNPVESNYTLARWYSFSVNYFPLNAHNAVKGPIFRQQYFRQALQSLVDQKSIIKAAAHGYASATNGPTPTAGVNPFGYSPGRARQLLASHGWSTPPDGVGVCQRPGPGPDQCGPDVPAGATLEFQMLYMSSNQTTQLAMEQLQSSATKVGIRIDLQGAPFNTVIATAIPCQAGKPDCQWELANWGNGWVFSPDYYPTGELLFSTGAGSNVGSFSDPKLDALIARSQASDDPAAMAAYERYGSQTVPVIWEPNYDYLITAIANNLRGVTPQCPYLNITPEEWYYLR
jgi:peptide/nickel transport system substrate-binding protein